MRGIISVGKYQKFSQRQAQSIAQRQVGLLGFARLNRHTEPHRRCEVGKLVSIGDAQVLGSGRSFRKAFEDAGVYFKEGDQIEV